MGNIIWRDIDISFDKANDGDIKTNTNMEAIKNSISNICQTLQGERRMIPDAFAPVWGLLFEQMDEQTSMNLGSLLLQAVEEWEDRVYVENINVDPRYDQNMYVVQLTFRIINSTEIETMEFILITR